VTTKAPPSEEACQYATTKLLAQVAHDIRSPAGVVLNALEEVAHQETPEGRLAMVAMARRGVARLLRLADRLSMVAELRQGVAFEKPLGDLRALAERAVDQAIELQGRRNVTVEKCLGEDVPVRVPLDARWLEAAVAEVVQNGLRYARSQVRTTMRLTEKAAELLVEDDGPGFPPDFDITGAFRPRAGVNGLGLSIALAFDVCEGHGGTLRIDTSTLPPYRGGAPGAAVSLTIARA
jgi:signal transduction histidine kinase